MLTALLCVVMTFAARGSGEDDAALEENDAGTASSYVAVLVGALVQGTEVSSFEVLQSGSEFLVPLEEFVGLCGCSIGWTEQGAAVSTPLGVVQLSAEEISVQQGIPYVKSEVIQQRFQTAVAFEFSTFALSFDFPWSRRVVPQKGRGARVALIPQVEAPAATLSTLRFDLRNEQRGDLGYTSGYGSIAGRLAGGWWRGRFESNSSGRLAMRDYGWTRTFGKKLLLVGHQRLSLNPLMRSLELTGAQFAWTNQPLEVFERSQNSNQLLPRRLRSAASFAGYGPPAGMAELRVNDRIVARQRISLGGHYEFFDIPLPARQANRIEVFLYDRRNLLTPVGIDDHSRTGSDLLLPKGGLVVTGGAGLLGNPADEFIGDSFAPGGDRSGMAGFSQIRYGLTEGWSLDGMVQSDGSSGQVVGSVIGQLGRHFGLSGGLSSSNGTLGYDFDFYGRGGRWRLTATSRLVQPGFYSQFSEANSDHYVEAGYRLTRRLDLGLIARSRKVFDVSSSFLLPSVYWTPFRKLSLRARPDYDGSYRLDVQFLPRMGTSIGMSTSRGYTYVYLAQDVRSGLRLTFGNEFTDRGGHRQSAVVDWMIGENRRTSLSLGGLLTNGRPGFLVGVNRALNPGLLVGSSYESDSLSSLRGYLPGESELQSRWMTHLSGDLALAGGRFIPADSLAIDRSAGGIAGRLKVVSALQATSLDLQGVAVSVDRRVAAETDAAGSYFIGQLPAGVYVLTIDPGGLPIELSPVKNRVTVEVAPGAVTRFDFELRAEYGIAGRVRLPNGQPAIAVMLELIDSEGKVVSRTATDQFGLYRIDGLPVASYVLQVVAGTLPQGVTTAPVRRIELTDDFLFDQDLQLK